MKAQLRFAAAVLVAAVVAVPVFAQRGSADFSNFVALGDSYGAGFSSASLNERHQAWSWPAVIARQVGLTLCDPTATATTMCFAQPLVSYPGLGPEIHLDALAPSPVFAPAAGRGTPLMTTFARPYNNLSIPGATVGALLSLTGAEQQTPGEPTAVSMARFILRGQGTAVQQALALDPTFIALWIGGNDYLSTMFSGTTATLTSEEDFRTRYQAVLDSLIAGAPNAGFVVGNLPAVVPPYLRLVPPVLIDPSTGTPFLVEGQPIYWRVDLGDGNSAPIAPTTLIPLHTREKLAQGYGLPAAFRFVHPFNLLPHVGEPLSPNDVITQEELQEVFARVASYNAIIQELAAARQIPVADIAGLFNRVEQGIQIGPIRVTSAPVTGGFFSFDFFHLTDLGYLLFANEYIQTINEAYDTEIPVASIVQLFQNNGADFGEGGPGPWMGSMTFTGTNQGITTAGLQQIIDYWSQPVVRRGRWRAVGH